jgi:YVTN family beta-propeller protein
MWLAVGGAAAVVAAALAVVQWDPAEPAAVVPLAAEPAPPPSAATAGVARANVPASVTTARFVPVAPARLFDSRRSGPLPAASITRLRVAGVAGVPATATAAALNVTVTEAGAAGFVTVWPAGTAQPTTSNVNVEHPSATVPNLVVVPLGVDGSADVFTLAAAHVVVDVVGAWEPAASATSGRLQAVQPVRVLDTRQGGIVPNGGTVEVDVSRVAGTPSGAVLNVTATEATGPGFVTVWAAGRPRPDSSNLDIEEPGQTVANLVVTPTSPDGKVALFAQTATHLVVDVVGVFTDDSAAASADGLLVPLAPARLLDTRTRAPLPRLTGGARADLPVAGQADIPAAGASAVIVNLTMTESSDAAFVTAYPAQTALPPTSNLNAERTWQTRANLAVVALGTSGSVSLYAQRTTQLVADVFGWFTGAPAEPDPTVPATPAQAALPSSDGTLTPAGALGVNISPKSVVATGSGLVFAQNMIYSHTISVYGRDHRLITTISDLVNGQRGGPVEAAVTPDGRSVYVSNYSMYGPGAGREGFDACTPADDIGESTVYRVNVGSLGVDQVIPVGRVPKFLAVTPDGRLLVVSNWCGDDVSIVDTATAQEVRRVHVGHNPRGVAITADSRTAYIALMGGGRLALVDLATGDVRLTAVVGSGPRHLNLSPDGRWLYVTMNGEGTVAKYDTTTEQIVARVASGTQPRSAALAADGANLFVVNYESANVSKVRTSDMTVVQRVPTTTHPIGVTYDDETKELWVACYVGRIFLFRD